MTPWNVDTIGRDGFSRTVINVKPAAAEEELSEEEKGKRLQKFCKENKALLDEFGLLRKYEDSKRFLLEHPQLAHENTANYLTLECVNHALLEKFELMNHVSHQCIAIQFLLELSKQLKVDPRVSGLVEYASEVAIGELLIYLSVLFIGMYFNILFQDGSC